MGEKLNPQEQPDDRELRLTNARERAQSGDVSHYLQRWFREEIQAEDPDILEIMRQGYISEARNWLESAKPEGMKRGVYTRQQRIAEAQKYADLASIDLNEISGKSDQSKK